LLLLGSSGISGALAASFQTFLSLCYPALMLALPFKLPPNARPKSILAMSKMLAAADIHLYDTYIYTYIYPDTWHTLCA